jgi:ABC-type branched-subunit amino acid transport system substrate-binding protein
MASVLGLSCSGSRSSQGNRATVLEPAPPVPTEALPPESNAPAARESETEPPDAKTAPGRFQVAILLPFTLDQRSLDQLRDQNPLKNNRPLVSIGLYEGMLMALDSLRLHQPGLDVFVYDTKNSAEEVRRITAKPEFKQTDLILGPLFELELQEAASYARQESIPLVSPLRKVSGQQRLSTFFALNPGEEELFRLLGADLEQRERRSRMLILRQENEADLLLSKAFQAGFKDSLRRTQVAELVTNFRLSGLEDKLSSVQPNVLFVPSRDEVFVNALCRRLSGLSSAYQVRVYGLEDWREFQSIAPDNFDKIDLHFPVAYWPGMKTAFAAAFEAAYRQQYHAPPSEYVYRGYDLMLYFGRLMQVHGQKWPDTSKLPTRFAGMNDGFRFAAVPPATGSAPDHASNRTLHLLRYQDGAFLPVP